MKQINRKLPAELESIEWGWAPDTPGPQPPDRSTPALDEDPLSSVRPVSGPAVFLSDRKRPGVRFFLIGILTLAFLLSTAGKFYFKPSPVMDGVFLVCYSLWLFSLGSTPLRIGSFVTRIDCRADSLEITYWLRRKTVRIPWEKISEVKYSFYECEIPVPPERFRFLLGKYSGFDDWKAVLATVVRRASLRFAGSSFQKKYYRRGDALPPGTGLR